MNKSLNWLVPIIFFLALFAAGAGIVWVGDGQPFTTTNIRGELVTINARGLYYWDTVSSAAQMQGNDLVTLVLGLPLLAISVVLSLRGSLRGKLLMTGTLGFFLYTYMSMCFGTAYNPLFLVYTALFSLSLFAFILSIMSFDIKNLPARFSERLPRRVFAGLFFFVSAFLLMAWLSRIIPTISPDRIPALENVTSMFIQAMDLGMVVPLSVVSAILLLRKNAYGYLLTSVATLKFTTLGVAITVMVINMSRAGVPASPVELAIFPLITLINLVLTVVLLKNIKPEENTLPTGLTHPV